MKEHHIEVLVTTKPEVPDPIAQGMTEKIHAKGFESAQVIQSGQFFQLTITAETREEAVDLAAEAGQRLLANPVIQNFEVLPEEKRKWRVVSPNQPFHE